MTRAPRKPIVPARLTPQSQAALVAPAFSFDPALLEAGRARIAQQYGLKTVMLGSVHERESYFAGTDTRRANELYRWLTHPGTDAVIAIRGGYGCARIYEQVLRRLRKRRTRLAPKIVVGYSDLTVFLNGLHQELGWITFHGPVVVGRPFQSPEPLEESSFRALFSAKPLGTIQTPQMRALATGKARGRIVGGCLSLVLASLGTPYEIQTDNKVLFLEDVDEKPYRLDRMLTQLLHAGKLDRVRALVFGQMAHCEPAPESRDPSRTTAHQAIAQALAPLLRRRRIPVILDFPAGHGSPQLTFPIGAQVEVRASRRGAQVEFLEPGVR